MIGKPYKWHAQLEYNIFNVEIELIIKKKKKWQIIRLIIYKFNN